MSIPIPFKKKPEEPPTEDDLFLRRHVEWMKESGMYLPSVPSAKVHTIPSKHSLLSVDKPMAPDPGYPAETGP